MSRINVQVSGPKQADFTYKTVVLKGNASFKDQIETAEGPTKYVIKWDFDLNDEVVTVPENCILEFDGGSIDNGTIIGQDTVFINVGDVDIWGENLTRLGTWKEHSGGGGDIQDAFGSVKVGEEIIVAEGNDTLEIEAGENVTIEADPETKKVVINAEGEEQVQSNWNESNSQSKAYIRNRPNLAQVAITGNYNDLNNKPDIPKEITVDSSFDLNSDNPVQNKVITEEFQKYYKRNQTYNITETYNKEEIGNIISNTPESDVIIVDINSTVAQELTPADTEAAYFDDSGTITASADYTIKKYSLEDVYNLHFTGSLPSGAEYPFVAWFDANDVLLYAEPYQGASGEAVSYTKEPVTAPANAAYLYLNVHNQTAIGSVFGNDVNKPLNIPTALSILIPNALDPQTGKSTRNNKIYRVTGPTNTSFSDWAWNGDETSGSWVMLAKREPGIDDEIKEGSTNIPTSDAVASIMKRIENEATNTTGIQFALTDKFGNTICYIDESRFHILIEIVAKSIKADHIDGVVRTSIIEGAISSMVKIAWTDQDYNIILAITQDNKLWSGVIDFDVLYRMINEYTADKTLDFWERNEIMKSVILNDAGKGTSKRLQLAVIADSHEWPAEFHKAIKASEEVDSVDAVIFLGDQIDNVSAKGSGMDHYHSKYEDIINSAIKPLFMTPGNHDVGDYCKTVQQTRSTKIMYERFVKPAVDKGFLAEGEYQVNKPYYYHDFDEYKIRLIMLYPNDDNNGNISSFDTKYWRPIPYDETADSIAKKHYNEGDIVNINYYEDYSFECCKTGGVDVIATKSSQGICLYPEDWERVTYNPNAQIAVRKNNYNYGDVVNVVCLTDSSLKYTECSFRCKNQNGAVAAYNVARDFIGSDLVPTYKALRIPMWYSQNQLDWFCNTLEDAGDNGYLCLVAQHYSYMEPDVYHAESRQEIRFDEGGTCGNYDYRFPLDSVWNQQHPGGSKRIELIASIVDAYQKGGNININIAPISTSPEDRSGSNYGRGYDDTSALDSVILNKTFNSSGSVLFLHGHNHKDTAIRHLLYNQLQIGFLCYKKGDANTAGNIVRDESSDSIAGEHVDFITVYGTNETMTNHIGLTVPKNVVHITRAGNYYSKKIDHNTHALTKKDNEVIYF